MQQVKRLPRKMKKELKKHLIAIGNTTKKDKMTFVKQ